MSNLSPAPGTPQTPTKMVMAVLPGLVAMLIVLLDQGKDVLPAWLILLISALVAGLLVYVVPNKATSR